MEICLAAADNIMLASNTGIEIDAESNLTLPLGRVGVSHPALRQC